jgi:hypothetical protein
VSHPFNIITRRCTITGSGGAALATGDVITGTSAMHAIVMSNGDAKCKFEVPVPGTSQVVACHLFLTRDGEDLRCFDTTYGDYSYFFVGNATEPDRVRIIEATPDACEISIEWDNRSLGSPGLVERNPAGTVNYYNNAVESPFSQATAHYLSSLTTLRKCVRMVRGLPGYFLAWRSTPDVTPIVTAHSQGLNNDKDHGGEREFGTGAGTAVAWASTGKIAYFPAWRSQRDWSAVTTAIPSFDNFAWWPGIDDAPYANWDHATVIAMQPSGFPTHQTTGPWYVARIPVSGYGGSANVASVLVQQNPNEIGVWCYAGQSGIVVNHLTNPWIEADGQKTRFPIFVGAVYHEPDATSVAKAGYTGTVAYGNEPSAAVQASVTALVASVDGSWPT